MTFAGVAPGALIDVRVQGEDGTERTSTHLALHGSSAAYTSERLQLPRPLRDGDKVTAEQSMTCDRPPLPSMRSREAQACPNNPLDPVLPPLCTGHREVVITRLMPPALLTVTLTRRGAPGEPVVLGETNVSESTYHLNLDRLLVPGLRLGDRLTVQQRLCDEQMSETTGIVEGFESDAAPPALDGPLIACATQVVVLGGPPGALVDIESDRLGVISPEPRVAIREDAVTVVPVTPALIKDHLISAKVAACDGTHSMLSEPRRVRGLDEAWPPDVELDAFTCARTATARTSIPAGYIEVRDSREDLIGRAPVNHTGQATIGLTRPLLVSDDVIEFRQVVCGWEGDWTPHRLTDEPIVLIGPQITGPRTTPPFDPLGAEAIIVEWREINDPVDGTCAPSHYFIEIVRLAPQCEGAFDERSVIPPGVRKYVLASDPWEFRVDPAWLQMDIDERPCPTEGGAYVYTVTVTADITRDDPSLGPTSGAASSERPFTVVPDL